MDSGGRIVPSTVPRSGDVQMFSEGDIGVSRGLDWFVSLEQNQAPAILLDLPEYTRFLQVLRLDAVISNVKIENACAARCRASCAAS